MPIVTTSSRKRPRGHSALFTLRSSLAIAAVVLVAVAVYLGARAARPRQAPPPMVSDTTEKPASIAGSPDAAAPSAATGGAAFDSAEPERGETPHLPEAAPSTLQPFNSSTPASAKAEEPDPPPQKPPKHFRHPSEQLLAMMLSTPPDVAMPPLPHLDPDDARLNADALAAATNDLVIYDTDGRELESLKENVAGVKFQLAEVVAKGGNVADALNEFREHQNEGVEIRNETIRAINSIEDDQAAAETFRKANEELVREDIAPIRPEEVGFAGDDDDEPESPDSR